MIRLHTLFLAFLPFQLLEFVTATSPNALYIGYNCTGSANNSANDSNRASPLYLYNLYNLLGTFTTHASDTAYYNSSLGETPNRVYAFYICRFDQNAKSCTACINGAKDRILKACPYQTEAIIWYENCMMRYSRFSFFGKMDVSPWIPIVKPQNISKAQVGHFAESMRKSMSELATLTAGNSSSKTRFQVRAVNLSGFGSLYETAQCVPEITAKDCHLCLTTAIARLSISVSARALLPSCIVWYQTTPFYNSSQITYPLFNSSSTIHPPSTNWNKTSPTHGNSRRTKLVFGTIFVSIPIASLLALVTWIYMRKKKATETSSLPFEEIKTMESLHFDLSTIRVATRNFCMDNKLGEGGFGAVYKGILDDGQEIALKRLGKQSKQGIVEFKTEVVLLAKLQHKNLVRLLGFCAASDEKILIYEYLKNSSLDRFLFDPSSNLILDWTTRYNIILGIARGLLYLHEDSRLKIIHRDLKSSNILLDKVMNPKISDFGLAKLFVGDETQGDTKRIVGTYGYMAPEYAMTGHFSVKSDVYSFGVIILEIVTGQKNIIFGRAQVEEALLHRAWRLWNEGTPLDLVDTALGSDYPEEEVKKCIHIGLLCIQDIALERPRMASIVAALNGQSISLPMPKAPHFFGDPTTVEVPPVLYNQLMEGTAVEYHQHQELDQDGRLSVYSGTKNITEVYPR